jgi:uncharacterized protein (UPF0333 family)
MFTWWWPQAVKAGSKIQFWKLYYLLCDGYLLTYQLKYPALPGIQDKVKEIEWLIIAKKNYFAKVQYNDDFYTYSSFSLTYSHTYCNINDIKILL